MKKIYLVVFCSFIVLLNIYSQDRHFTLYDFAPLTLNPAMTGAFNGSYRVGGIYRNQAPSLGIYSTPNFYLDVPLIKGFRKSDWLGVGINFWSDRAGKTAQYSQTLFGLSVAYHLGLNKKQTQVLTFGLFGGSRSNSFKDVRFGETETIGGIQTTSLTTESKSSIVVNFGAMLRTDLSKTSKGEFGVSLNNLFGSNDGYSFIDSVDFSQPILITAHGKVNLELNDLWSVTPQVFLQSIGGGGFESALQVWANRALVSQDEIDEAKKDRRSVRKDKVLRAGLGYRFGNAAEILLGMDYKNLRFGFSYDLTLSGQSVIDNSVGGFEIAVGYIGKIYKQPKVKPVNFCPRF